PLGIVDGGGFGRRGVERRQLERAEKAAALEVGAHNRADGGRSKRRFAGEGRNGYGGALLRRPGDLDLELRAGAGGREYEYECAQPKRARCQTVDPCCVVVSDR